MHCYPVLYSNKKSSKNTLKLSFNAAVLHCLTAPLCSTVASLGGSSPTQWVGACLLPHPAALHTSQGRSIMVCLMQGETSIIRAEAETTAQNTKERGRGGCRHRPQPALLQVSSFDTALMAVWWVHMGRHGFIRTCLHARLHNIYGVYAQPTYSFFPHSEGGFSCGKLLRKKQLRIPKQYTTMGDIICAMCVPCPSPFLSGMAWLFLICAQPNPPTDKPQIEWRGGGWVGMVIAYCGARTPLFCHKQLLVVHNLIPSAPAGLKLGHILIVCGNPEPGSGWNQSGMLWDGNWIRL